MSEIPALKVNANRLNDTLQYSCQWGATNDGGMNRLSLNDDDKSVRTWFIDQVKQLGCTVKVDEMGSIFATRPGENNDIPPIALASHLDTQPKGGRYDGILGVNAALEVLRTIHHAEYKTYAPLCIVDWTNEEGARFTPAMIASGVWGGAFDLDYAHSRTDAEGKSIKSELERIGFLGSTGCSYTQNPLSAHFECHIEQGPILDDERIPVAAVLGVQSIRWYSIKLRGREQHTGTTPMHSRKDTLLAAAKLIVATNEIAVKSTSGGLASIAVINSRPQSINTLSGEVDMNLDLRHPTDQGVQALEDECRREFEKICQEICVKMEFETIWVSPAVKFDEMAVGFVKEAVKEVGYETALMSGAGHDSVYTARKAPTAMVFVRCKDGISHHPAEYSSPEDCAIGAQVLLSAYLRYDTYLREKDTK